MIYNTLPKTNQQISCLTLGTWVFGGDCWGQVKEQDCIKAVRTAMDQGINCLDTAPIYGNGQAERIIGKAIKGKRDQVVIATKCGLRVEGKRVINDLSAGRVRVEIEQSLFRLETDYIDIYQCHWPDPQTHIESTLNELVKLKKEGKIRYIGVSNFDPELLAQATDITEIITTQGQYSLLDHKVEKNILPFCRSHDVGFLAYGPLAGGILSGKYAEAPNFKGADARKFFYKYYVGERFQMVQSLLEKVKTIDRPLSQIAINWVRQQPGVASVIVGCRRCEQVLENLDAVSWQLSEDQLTQLRQYCDALELT